MAALFKTTIQRTCQVHRTSNIFAKKYGTDFRFKLKAFGIVSSSSLMQSSKNAAASSALDQPELKASSTCTIPPGSAGRHVLSHSSSPECDFNHPVPEPWEDIKRIENHHLIQISTSTAANITNHVTRARKNDLEERNILCNCLHTNFSSSFVRRGKSISVPVFKDHIHNYSGGNFLEQTLNLMMEAPKRHYATRPRSRANKDRASYYDVLNITPNATQAQVKKAYFKLSKIYHPDKNAGSKEAQRKFASINEAYSVLGNVTLRKRYDRGTLNQRDVHVGVTPEEKAAEEQIHRDPMETTSGVMFNLEAKRQAKNMDEFFSKHYKDARDKEQRDRAERQKRVDEYMDLQRKAKLSPLVLAVFMLGSLVMGVRSITKNSVLVKTEK